MKIKIVLLIIVFLVMVVSIVTCQKKYVHKQEIKQLNVVAQQENAIFHQYKQKYPLLENVTLPKNYTITPLKGKIQGILYQDLNSNYFLETLDIINTDKKSHDGLTVQDYQYSFYKISADGNVIDMFTIPETLTLYSGYEVDDHHNSYLVEPYLVGKGIYSNWLTTADPTIHNVKLSPKILDDKTFDHLFSESVATFIVDSYFTDDLRSQGLRGYKMMMLNKEGQWAYFDAHLVTFYYDERMKMQKAYTLSKAKTLSKINNFDFDDNRPSKISPEIGFDSEYLNSLRVKLTLDYFYITYHAPPPKFINIHHNLRDEGVAFLTLTFHGQDLKFRTKEIACFSVHNCLIPITIIGNERFIIIDGKYILRPL